MRGMIHHNHQMATVCCILLMLCMHHTWAAKLLLMPIDHTAHVNTFTQLGKALQDKGHDVTMLTQERSRQLVERAGVNGVFHAPIRSESPVADKNYATVKEAFFEESTWERTWRVISLYDDIARVFVEFCREVTADQITMGFLTQSKFDLAIVDGSPLGRCLYIIAYKLQIPYISIQPFHDPWSAGIPAMPSSEGIMGFFFMPSNPSFVDRVKSLAIYLTFRYKGLGSNHRHDSQVTEMAPELPPVTYTDLYKASHMFFVNTDNTCVEYARLGAPHYHFVGGTGASPARPLKEPFAKFMDSATVHGAIVVSFGSFVKRVPDALMDKLMAVFRRLPQKIIMRYSGEYNDKDNEGLPNNVLLTEWLPQNDLLGHPNTRLFIAHGGLNGQMEAMYHGLPMIVMPLSVDQNYNAQRAEDKRFGKMVDPFAFTADELYEAVQEALINPEYENSVKKCSAIIKSFPPAHDTINFWVEHVLKFGSFHLKPASVDMPLWKLFMLDVLLVVGVVTLVLCCITYRCCKVCYRRCRRRRTQKLDKGSKDD